MTKRHLQLSPVSAHFARLKTGSDHLCHPVEDVYKPDLVKEAIEVFGADDPAHPSVAYLRSRVQDFYIGGKVQAIRLPTHFDYAALRCEILFLQPFLFSIVKINILSRHTFRTPRSIQKTFLEKSGCISNSQSHASSTP